MYTVIRSFLPGADMILKWPNDILVSRAKICGILLERVMNQIVVGIGVNITVTPEAEGRILTSLAAEGAMIDAAGFLDRLSGIFADFVEIWRDQGLPHILAEWQKLAHPVGSIITTSDERGAITTGEYVGLTADGALCLRKADGTLIEIRAGDISIG